MREINTLKPNNIGEVKSSLQRLYEIFLNLYRNVDYDMLQLWTYRNNFFNDIELHVAAVDNDQVCFNSNNYVQIKKLSISSSKLEWFIFANVS